MDSRGYKRAFVTYLDIVGFRNMIKRSETDTIQIYAIHSHLRSLRERMKEVELVRETKRKRVVPIFRAFGFSDLTVRVLDITDIEDPGDIMLYFKIELLMIANIQAELACQGKGEFPILLRGGMTVGPIQAEITKKSDDFVYGPALVRAYQLESETAVFPRIVIDRELYREMSTYRDLAWQPLTKKGEDGIYFIDYLATCRETVSGIGLSGTQHSLKHHKRMIETQLDAAKHKKFDERVMQKYLWLASYHNSIVNELPSKSKKDFYISPSLLRP